MFINIKLHIRKISLIHVKVEKHVESTSLVEYKAKIFLIILLNVFLIFLALALVIGSINTCNESCGVD